MGPAWLGHKPGYCRPEFHPLHAFFGHEQEMRAVMMDATAFTDAQEPPTHKVSDADLRALIPGPSTGNLSKPKNSSLGRSKNGFQPK
jgi:hypothetical protein